MHKWLNKLSRKERIYLLAGLIVLLFGCVIYPVMKTAASTRHERLEDIEALQQLVQDYQHVIEQSDELQQEHAELSSALEGLEFLMYRAASPSALQTQLMQEFGEMAPSLDLQISSGKAALSNRSQLSLNISARGTYSRILNFISELENHAPMICIDSIDINGAQRRGNHQHRGPQPVQTEGTQPNLSLLLKTHVNYRQEVAQ